MNGDQEHLDSQVRFSQYNDQKIATFKAKWKAMSVLSQFAFIATVVNLGKLCQGGRSLTLDSQTANMLLSFVEFAMGTLLKDDMDQVTNVMDEVDERKGESDE